MKLTQKHAGQVAERICQAGQGCAGLQDTWGEGAKLEGRQQRRIKVCVWAAGGG